MPRHARGLSEPPGCCDFSGGRPQPEAGSGAQHIGIAPSLMHLPTPSASSGCTSRSSRVAWVTCRGQRLPSAASPAKASRRHPGRRGALKSQRRCSSDTPARDDASGDYRAKRRQLDMIISVKARLICQGQCVSQCGQRSATLATIRSGLGASARNTPGRPFRFFAARRSAGLGLRPCDGGSEELSGVLGGPPSFARGRQSAASIPRSVRFAPAPARSALLWIA